MFSSFPTFFAFFLFSCLFWYIFCFFCHLSASSSSDLLSPQLSYPVLFASFLLTLCCSTATNLRRSITLGNCGTQISQPTIVLHINCKRWSSKQYSQPFSIRCNTHKLSTVLYTLTLTVRWASKHYFRPFRIRCNTIRCNTHKQSAANSMFSWYIPLTKQTCNTETINVRWELYVQAVTLH